MASAARFPPILAILALSAPPLGVGACAARSRGDSSPPARSPGSPASIDVELEPVRVEGSRDPAGDDRVEAYDARELFDRAGAELDADRYARALALYDRLVAVFPDSQLATPAHFNAGLALEGMRRLDQAMARYLAAAGRAGATRYGLDAHIRAGAVAAELARWSDALRAFDALLARGDLGAADRIEIQARRGYVLVESGRHDEAERALADALELARTSERGLRVETAYFAAMAQYYLGEIPRRRAEAMHLQLPDDRLQRDLEARAKLVLLAQHRFEDTIRRSNLYWATAAGYQLGSMQQEMWRALVAAPVPSRLDAKAAAIYTAEVRALARAHLDKALAAHAMNQKVAAHHATQTPWSLASSQRIAELEQLIASEATRASASGPEPRTPRSGAAAPAPPSPARPRHQVPRRLPKSAPDR
jgi:tetratricopeptide (TPR) repeat protein